MQDTLEDIQIEQCLYLDGLGCALRFVFSHPKFAIDGILTPVSIRYQNSGISGGTKRMKEAYHPTTNDFPFSSGARAQSVTPPNAAEVHLHDLNRSNAVNSTVLLPPSTLTHIISCTNRKLLHGWPALPSPEIFHLPASQYIPLRSRTALHVGPA